MQQFRHRQFPASNPLANALVIIVGTLVIGISLVLGVVAFVALLAAAIVLGVVVAARSWWLNRGLRAGRREGAERKRGNASEPEIIEGEFHVVSRDKGRDSGS